jgi:hypothetical protein
MLCWAKIVGLRYANPTYTADPIDLGVEATIFNLQEKPLAVSKKQVYISYFLLNGDKPNASCQHPA